LPNGGLVMGILELGNIGKLMLIITEMILAPFLVMLMF
jgi:hypothetical protein